MKTIRTKLSVLFLVFMLLVVSCGILLNALFLQRYYIYKNRRIFLETSEKIKREYFHKQSNISDFINVIDRVNGISCTITGPDMSARFNSFPQKPGRNAGRLPNEIERLIFDNENRLANSYVYAVVEKPSDQAPKLVFVSRLADGGLIILRKSMKGIGESVAIANQFYMVAGMIIILLGGVFIVIFSKRITEPIVEMSNVAEGIANLDFEKRVAADSRDEIGSLGQSINRISEKLSASMNALQQDVERRKQLVRNISHELKTPIGVIKGYAEGLKYGVVEDKEKASKYCTIIAEESDRMDRMVRELLNLSMLESGMFQIKINHFNLEEFIQNSVERFAPALLEKGITLEVNCQKNLVVAADDDLLGRVVNNFMTNAVDHAEGDKRIKVTVQTKVEGIGISVFNTGKHISEDDLNNIWDVFYKVDKARTRQYSGHGLGLSIVRLIADLHGGNAGVENVKDGVEFFIELPK